jgi:prolyl-tRNA synthetase
MQKDLYDKAMKHREDNVVEVDSYDAFKQALEEGKFVLAHWNGKAESEKQIKDETKATIRCLPFAQKAEAGTCVLTGEPSTQRVLFARSY